MADWSKLISVGSNALSDLGYGLTQGTNLQQSLSAAGQRTQAMEAPRAQAEVLAQQEQERQTAIAKQQEMVSRYAQELSKDPANQDLVAALSNGVIQPADAWGEAMKRRSGSSGTDEYGLTPIYGTGPNGETVVLQPSKAGGLRQAQMPDGVSLATGVDKIDLGTQWGLIDKRTGQMVGTAPKDNYTPAYDAASGGAKGKSDVETMAGAPQAIANADQSIGLIDALASDPNLDWAIGMAGLVPPVAGTPQAGVVARIDQLKGQAFLQAFESLKGGGQITEVEGRKATEAIARLNRSQNKQDFLQALKEIRDVVETAKQRIIAKTQPGAGAPVAGPTTGGRLRYNPLTGELE